jgi:hypothetical protein
LDYLGWNGWGISEVAWTVVMLVIGAGLTTVVSLSRRDVAYALVIVWAFVGIAVKHTGTPTVAITAVVAAVWAAGAGAVATMRRL